MTAILTREVTPSAAVDCSAGFGRFTTRVHVNGYRFEIADDGESVATFRSCDEIAMAVYLSGQPVRWGMSPTQIAGLIVTGINQNGYARVVEVAAQWRRQYDCPNPVRHQVCTDLAYRLSNITKSPRDYQRYPQWQPDWRDIGQGHRPGVLARRESREVPA